MAKLLDQVLVIDVESTCWDGPPPEGESSEIIEIGLCPLDLTTLERGERRCILVAPVRSSLSPFCSELTTLRAADLAGAGSLGDACRILKKEHQSKRRLWASYGDYDRRQFERCCREAGVAYPFGPGHLNVKTLFAIQRGLDREVGMDRALGLLGWELEGTHHRGVDDAYNIARILGVLLEAGRSAS